MQCAEHIVHMISTYLIVLAWSFPYIKKNLIEYCEKCEKTVHKPEENRDIRLLPIFHL